MSVAMAAWLAGLIALAVSYVELLARYRDDPLRAVLSWPAFSYGLINGGAGLLAAWWISTYFPSLATAAKAGLEGVSVDPVKLAIIAGLGSLAVLRTSLMKLHTGAGDDISVGPAVIIDQLLSVVDRGVDRHLAERRAQLAGALAAKIDFPTQSSSLVALCLVLLQNSTAAEALQIQAARDGLAGRLDMPGKVKSMSLVLALLGLVGERVLSEAVDRVQ